MRKDMEDRNQTGFSKLSALCWWAKKTGVSYGTLSATCTEEQLQEIYEEYRQICEERWREQKEREEAYRASRRQRSRKKTRS